VLVLVMLLVVELVVIGGATMASCFRLVLWSCGREEWMDEDGEQLGVVCVWVLRVGGQCVMDGKTIGKVLLMEQSILRVPGRRNGFKQTHFEFLNLGSPSKIHSTGCEQQESALLK